MAICATYAGADPTPAQGVSVKSPLPAVQSLHGKLQHYVVKKNDSLPEIARRFDVGFNAIVEANPGVDPMTPMVGTMLTIPTAWIFPTVSNRPAMVINLAEFRLYLFPKGRSGQVQTFPLGIGDQGSDTPLGSFAVTEKIRHPAWKVPLSIRKAAGLPETVPPGPDNPMGSHALRLSLPSILIHGTDRPWGIGRRSSHGCLRLYPEDIVRLYRLAPRGTRVVIVNQPIKVCTSGGKIFVEVHGYRQKTYSAGLALRLLAERNLLIRTDFAKLIKAVEDGRGVPVEVTLAP